MTGTTYLPTDLQRRYRLVLDQARAGEARVRDLDGTTILLLRETEVQTLRQVGLAAANLAVVERVLEVMATRRPDLSEYGEWTWLRTLDEGDLREFVREVREGIVVAVREGTTTLLDEHLRAWRVTAQQAQDPVLRTILQGGASEADFVEVSRPGGAGADQGSRSQAPIGRAGE
jgi:hypothetical protein